MIKSALEIALERTKGIEVDKQGLKDNETRDEGKRLIGKYLSGDISAKELSSAISAAHKEQARLLKEGCVSILTANLTLPSDENYKEKLERLRDGFIAVMGQKKQVSYLFQQVDQFFEQYLANQEQLVQALEKQFAPRLKQREQELERQYGHKVPISPSQDPEFSKVLKQHLGQLESQYGEALKQAKDQLNDLFNES